MKKGNERIAPSGKRVVNNGMTYIMTDYPYTQPMIFNTINASISKGLVYAVVTIAALLIFNPVIYLDLFPADVAMINGMLYICLVVKPKVCRGQIARVSMADSFGINLAGETLGFMWSAFARLPVMMAVAMINDEISGLGEIASTRSKIVMVGALLGGVIVFVVALLTLVGTNESVEENHRRVMGFYKRIIGYREPKTQIDPVTQDFTYGEIRNNTTAPVRENKSSPKPNPPARKPENKMDRIEPVEEIQPRVNRKRRNIEL